MRIYGAYSCLERVCVMLCRNIKLIVLLSLVVIFTPQVYAGQKPWKMIHGDVLQVLPEQQKFLLHSVEGSEIYVLENDCIILRSGKPTTLDALRPIAPDAFQDVLCWLNSQGLISYIFVNYSIQEEQGILVSRDIFGNVK